MWAWAANAICADPRILIEIARTTIDLMSPENDLELLMASYQDGDFAAATVLINRISPKLHRFFLAQSASRENADDLLQETWLRIHKVRHTYHAAEPVMPWFYAIARHVRVDHYRKTMRIMAHEKKLDEVTENAAAIPGQSYRGDSLEVLLAPLPESQREVIEMLKAASMSLEEVARATSSSVGSVKQKVHRAYKKLRETIGPAGLGKTRSGGVS